MFRSLFPFRRLLATTFLVVFVNVFVGQCWCAPIHPVLAAPAATAQSRPTHAGGHGKASAQHNLVKAKHNSSRPSGKHECCKDKSASVLSSLTMPGQKHLTVPAPALLPVTTDYFFRPAAGQWDRTPAVVLVLREHLPPKIPDIRIFLQSLTV
jgi:hypothetical protein